MSDPDRTTLLIEDLPVYWFSVLDRAIDRGDLKQAAEAQRELARLGIRVEYQFARPCRRPEVPAHG